MTIELVDAGVNLSNHQFDEHHDEVFIIATFNVDIKINNIQQYLRTKILIQVSNLLKCLHLTPPPQVQSELLL